ncbi:MAG TPA: FkbM family methyltransferase [Acidimicrobiales bacterium]|nr:FkbM family methyltransferase [Acidimicrobiales bacterium]
MLRHGLQLPDAPANGDVDVGVNVMFPYVRVAPGTSASFAVDPNSSDPIGQWLLTHGYPEEPPTQLFRHLLRKGACVIDVGAHLGTFAIAAAALECEVIAIEAAPNNVALLLAAAARNSFDRCEIVHAIVADRSGTAEFEPDLAWGHVVTADVPARDQSITLPTVTVDALVRQRGWSRVDMVKIDVEGSELNVLKGMEQTLLRPDAPVLIIESNGVALRQYGSSPSALVQVLEDFGFALYLIDREVPGQLVPIDSTAVQAETVVDLLAVKDFESFPLSPWVLGSALTADEVMRRLRVTSEADHPLSRSYAAWTIERGPGWLRAHENALRIIAELSSDLDDEVRSDAVRAATVLRSGG